MALKLKITSKLFLEKLEELKARFTGERIAARLRVPPDLFFWYVHEFGSGSRGENGGSWYSIDPVNHKYLRWPEPNAPGGQRYELHVNHPGDRPTYMVTSVLPEIEALVGPSIMRSLMDSGWDPEVVRDTLTNETMEKVKEIIVASIGDHLPGSRADGGKLEGQTAADVFASESWIEGE